MTAEQLLHDIAFFSLRTDNRLEPAYENGYNDAVLHLTTKAREWFEAQGIDAESEEYWGEEE